MHTLTAPIILIDGKPATLTATYGLRWFQAYPKPVFIVSGAVAWNGDEPHLVGPLSYLIQKYCPSLRNILRLYLSSVDGLPPDPVARGWYYMGREEYGTYNRRAVADHFRISEEEADHLQQVIMTKADLEEYVNRNIARWKREADAVIAEYGLTVPTAPERV
jgi:hypothetical protein